MPHAVWTPIAESELDDILFYIAMIDGKPTTADRIYFEIRDRVTAQAVQKLPGQKHPDAPENWLYIRHKRWLIFYQPHAEGIEILRVVDSVRDMPGQF